MKKILLIISSLISLFLPSSCQRENLESEQQSGVVTYTVNIPHSIATKTNADDFTVYYEVYRKGEIKDMAKTPIYEGEKEFQGNSTSLNLEFVKGQEFTVLFWAQVAGSNVYTITDLRNVTLNTKVTSYDAAVEVFSGVDTVTDCVSAAQGDMKLERPIAQINIATLTSSLRLGNETTVVPSTTQFTVNGLCNSYNVASKIADGEVNVEYRAAAAPNTIFNTDYTLVGMNFIGFIPTGGATVDVTFTIDAGIDGQITHSVSNVPVKPNYRTNIIGNLISSTTDYSVTLDTNWDGILVCNSDELKHAIKESGSIHICVTDDIDMSARLDIKAGTHVYLDMNGKTISSSADYVFIIREGATLTIDGNGTVETETPAPVMFYPAGDLIIENGTFIRHIPEGYTGTINSMFVGTKPEGGWGSTGVTIRGGYFDNGYYSHDAAFVEEILAGDRQLEETEDDIKKRGQAGDKNRTRVALKNNVTKMLNKSNNYIKVYGGVFIGANPAWGDEGCMLPTTPAYLRPWSYYQGAMLDGQEFHEEGIVLPKGYTITHSLLEDGRPVYTVYYEKQ